MTKSTSPRNTLCRQIALVPLLVIAIFIFGTKTIAQNTPTIVKPKQKEIQSTKEGVSPEMLNEYEGIVKKNKLNTEFVSTSPSVIPDADKNRLETIFLAMSREQQAKQAVTFAPPSPPMPKNTPTEEQFKSFKNKKMYAITIDDRNVDNTVLNNYQPSDFGHFSIIYLAKTNKNYGKHLPVKVHLMTKENYRAYVKLALSNNDNIMIIRSSKNVAQK